MRIVILFIAQLIITGVSFAQDIRVQSHLSDFSFDSVLINVKQLSGELPVSLNGNYFIHLRAPGINKIFKMEKI